MIKVKNGDLEKLGLLYERYNRPLFSFFYRKTSEPQLSEDLVQSVFERMLKYRTTYSGSGCFSTWMFSIARNAHIDHFRKEKRRKENELLDEERIEGGLRPGYEDNNQYTSKKEVLEWAISKLDEDKKEVLILSKYEGLRYKEIAEIQGITESAVKVRMFRAMKDLKKFITELGEDFNHE